MNKSQIIAVAVAAIALLLLFFFAETSDPDIPDAEITGEVDHTDGHSPATAKTFELEDYRARVLEDVSDETVEEVLYWEGEMQSLRDSIRLAAIDSLIFIYSRENIPVLRAKLFMDRAEITRSVRDWTVAGDLHLQLLVLPDIPSSIKMYFYSKAETSYQEVIKLKPGDEATELKLAKVYVSMDGMQVMNGVQLLLGILEKDSSNIDAYLLLAENGLRSGQFDKATGRVESALNIRPRFAGQVMGLSEIGTLLSRIQYDQGQIAAADSMNAQLVQYVDRVRNMGISNDSLSRALDMMLVDVASVYLERQDNSVMQGIQILLKETEAKPDNYPAQLELIRQSLRSGQYEKAASRIEIVVSSQPDISEDYLELADLSLQLVDYYYSQDNPDESIRILEMLKMVSGENEKVTLNKAIEEIKNKKKE